MNMHKKAESVYKISENYETQKKGHVQYPGALSLHM